MTSQTQIQTQIQALEEIRNSLVQRKNELEKLVTEISWLASIAQRLVNALNSSGEERQRLVAYAVRDLLTFSELEQETFSPKVVARVGIYSIAEIDLYSKSVEICEDAIYEATSALIRNRVEAIMRLINEVQNEINRAIEVLQGDAEEI